MEKIKRLPVLMGKYSYIFVEHNYFFYHIKDKDKDTILILEMFYEKEDFMRKLFGIVTTSQK